jgi:Tfp pilus assembly protein PilZ
MLALIVKGRSLDSRTRDPVLAEETKRDERRRSGRHAVAKTALLRAGELTLAGVICDISDGGAFLQTNLLIEVGEHGVITVDEIEAPVQVIWLRGNAHEDGAGMGLRFASADDASRIRARVEA